jgi:hypothetical protein
VLVSVWLTWLGVGDPLAQPAPQNTPGTATGAGWFSTSAGKTHFSLHASYSTSNSSPAGQLRWTDASGTSVAMDTVTSFSVSGSTASFGGPCSVNGSSGYQCTVTATDNGKPAVGNDTIGLSISQATNPLYSYSQSGTLGGGNIHVSAG